MQQDEPFTVDDQIDRDLGSLIVAVDRCHRRMTHWRVLAGRGPSDAVRADEIVRHCGRYGGVTCGVLASDLRRMPLEACVMIIDDFETAGCSPDVDPGK